MKLHSAAKPQATPVLLFAVNAENLILWEKQDAFLLP
jgi:hypothetical protein